MRILMVDDSEDSRELTEAALLAAGHDDIVTAVSGRDTLEFLDIGRTGDDAVPIDIMLLDIVMPEMDGIEVCAHVRSDARYADLPIIMVTSVDDVNSLANALGAGATDYLAKPVNPVELTTRMRVALRRKQDLDHRKTPTRELFAAQNAPDAVPGVDSASTGPARNRALEVVTAVEKNKLRTRLQNEKDKLGAIRARIHGSSTASQDFEELQAVAHKLAGAAGIFGFARVSQSAAELEQLIIDTKPGDRSAETIDAELSGLLRVIVQECNALDEPQTN